MITNSKIGFSQQLGSQMNMLANLFYISIENKQEIVFWDELRYFRQGYLFCDVFNIKDIKYIKRSSFLKQLIKLYHNINNESGAWKKYKKFSFKYIKNFFARLFTSWVYNLVKSKYKNFIDYSNNLSMGIFVDQKLLSLDKNNNYDISNGFGTYQSFKKHYNVIEKNFIFKQEIIDNGDKIYNKILTNPKYNQKQIVSVHFRRTDYLLFYSLNLGVDYYNKAIKQFDSKKCVFAIFSDDIVGCKDFIKENSLFDGCECLFMKNNSYGVDMYLMSKCNHNIIANSTFSFWAALLNKHKNKLVVCPHDFVSIGVEGKDTGHESLYLNGNYYPDDWVAI